MIDTIVDMTQLCIAREIRNALQQSIKEKNCQAKVFLENYYYQKKLVNYIASHINHRYIPLELTEIPKEAERVLPQCPIAEKTEIRHLLQIGMSVIAKDILKQTI